MRTANTVRVAKKIRSIMIPRRRSAFVRDRRERTRRRGTRWRSNRERPFKSVQRKGPASKSSTTKRSGGWRQKSGAPAARRTWKTTSRRSSVCTRGRRRCLPNGMMRTHGLRRQRVQGAGILPMMTGCRQGLQGCAPGAGPSRDASAKGLCVFPIRLGRSAAWEYVSAKCCRAIVTRPKLRWGLKCNPHLCVRAPRHGAQRRPALGLSGPLPPHARGIVRDSPPHHFVSQAVFSLIVHGRNYCDAPLAWASSMYNCEDGRLFCFASNITPHAGAPRHVLNASA